VGPRREPGGLVHQGGKTAELTWRRPANSGGGITTNELQDAATSPRGGVVSPTRGVPTWAWQVEGPPDAPALLLLHGWMATAALNWYGSLEYLGRYFRAVAPDLRGHGREGRGAPPFSVEGCADDLAALIEELALGRAIVVGYSMGGAIAQVLARRHRDVVGGLVLCATAASFARRVKLRPAVYVAGKVGGAAARNWPDAAHRFLSWRIARHDRKVERQSQRRDGEQAHFEGQILATAGDEVAAEGARQQRGHRSMEWALAERSMSHLAAFIEAGAELNAYDSSRWLTQLDVPAAVLITARDLVVAPRRQEAMASLIPRARRYLVDGGHDSVVAHPEVFLPILRDACMALARGGSAGHGPV
jgi:3-oxoadipate enol-lactonase